jgi:tetratricopeptide (TPR) repeat protein
MLPPPSGLHVREPVERGPRFVAGAALGLLTLIAYWPAIGAGFIWDDDSHVTNNVLLHSAPGLVAIWTVIGAVPQYYPVTHTSFWLEYHLWGLHSLGYHLDNILMQAANAILLWRILHRLEVNGAWVISAIFAIHPLQVESVAWVTERKNVLSGLFFLLSLWTYLSFAWPEFSGGREGRRPAGWKYLASLGLFVLALLSKSVTGALPGVILVLAWWKRGRLTRRDVVPLLPFFSLAVAMGTLTGWLEKHLVGASGPEFDFSAWQRLGIAGRAVWFYAGKFLVPTPLMFIYPRWNVGHAGWLTLMLFPGAVAGALAAMWFGRRRIGRGPLAASLLFIGLLFPALGFVNGYPMRYSFVADHFQYLACIAAAAFTVGIASHFLPQRAKAPAATILLAALAAMTWHRAEAFHDLRTLWLDTLAKNPTSFIAHNNYGILLVNEGNLAAAERQFTDSLRVNPADPDALLNMAQVCRGRHDLAGAEAWFHRALAAVAQNSPASATSTRTRAWTGLGDVYADETVGNANLPQHFKAIHAYDQALKYSPDDTPALVGLGRALADEGDFDEAMNLYRRAIRQTPDSVDAHLGLGNACLAEHDLNEAAEQFQKVIQLDPLEGEAHNLLGCTFALLNQFDRAIAEFRATLAIDPGSAMAKRNLRRAIDARAHRGKETQPSQWD